MKTRRLPEQRIPGPRPLRDPPAKTHRGALKSSPDGHSRRLVRRGKRENERGGGEKSLAKPGERKKKVLSPGKKESRRWSRVWAGSVNRRDRTKMSPKRKLLGLLFLDIPRLLSPGLGGGGGGDAGPLWNADERRKILVVTQRRAQVSGDKDLESRNTRGGAWSRDSPSLPPSLPPRCSL